MNAEQLRETYNKYFSGNKNTWSSTDLRKTRKVVDRTVRWLRSLGYPHVRGKLLDVGCATGYYTEAFRKLGFAATGLDYSDVVIEQARQRFPQCDFVQMNGFEPTLTQEFDVIFCRGFSGTNTHDLKFIADWVNRYMIHLSTDGFFVLGYSSNFSGTEKTGETVNHSREELAQLVTHINGVYRGTFIFQYFGFVSKIKKKIQTLVTGKINKEYYYVFIQRK